MDENDTGALWKKFLQTGSIYDYLKYRHIDESVSRIDE